MRQRDLRDKVWGAVPAHSPEGGPEIAKITAGLAPQKEAGRRPLCFYYQMLEIDVHVCGDNVSALKKTASWKPPEDETADIYLSERPERSEEVVLGCELASEFR